jgi:acyl dehydratase
MMSESTMNEYYYDTWTEDGTSSLGYRETGWMRPITAVRRSFKELATAAVAPLSIGPVTRTDIVKYAGASWDYNPFHHDGEFAKQARSGGIIAHGMMVMGYLGRLATSHLGTADFDRLNARFMNVTRPGDTLRIEGTVKEATPNPGGGGRLVLSLRAVNQNGDVVSEGEVTATLPA